MEVGAMANQAGDLKTCPYCGESIRSEAQKCRFCGEWLTDPQASSPPNPRTAASQATKWEYGLVRAKCLKGNPSGYFKNPYHFYLEVKGPIGTYLAPASSTFMGPCSILIGAATSMSVLLTAKKQSERAMRISLN
jgi:zinc-ribbon domain